MGKSVIISFIFILIVHCINSAPISLDLNGSEASLYQNTKLKLNFKCTGGDGMYQFQFKNIPTSWSVLGNSIIIQNYAQLRDQNWRFDVYVTDSQGNYLSQTLMVTFMGFYVGFNAITLPVTGKINPSQIYNNNPFALLPGSQQNSFTNSPTDNQVDKQQPRLTDLVNEYPGMNNWNRLTNGYNNNSASSSNKPDYISTTQTGDPRASPYTAQKQAAIRRQTQANQNVASLTSLLDKTNLAINNMKQDMKVQEARANSARLLVQKCDEEVFALQDTKTKINNAISDKQERYNQYKEQINKSQKQITNENLKLTNLQLMKRDMQVQALPNSRQIQALQQQLDQCRSSSIRNSKQIQDTKINLQKTQAQIKLLSIQTNEAKAKLQKLKSDLKLIRQKISNLENQLQQARKQQLSILADITKNTEIPTNNQKKMKQLQADISNIASSSKTTSISACSVYQDRLSNIQNIVARDKQKYNQIVKNIADQQTTVQKAQTSLLNLRKSSNVLPMQINTLKTSLIAYQQNIRRSEYLCQDNVTQYSKIAISLKNLKDKIQQSTIELQKTNKNLNNAKNEQELANNAAAELIKIEANYLANNNIPSLNQNSINSVSNQQANQNKNSNINTNTNINTRPVPPKNPSQMTIDDIINGAISKLTPSATSTSSSSTNSSNKPTTTAQPPQQYLQPSGPTIKPTQNNQFQSQPQYQTQFQNQNNQSTQSQTQTQQFSPPPQQDFSISSFLSKSPAQTLTTNTNTQSFSSSGSSNLPPPSYAINNQNNFNNTQQNFQQISQQNPQTKLNQVLVQAPNSELSDDFRVSLNSAFKTYDAGNIVDYLRRNYKIQITFSIPQNRYLYTLDQVSYKNLIGGGGVVQAKFQPFICTDTSLYDNGIITDVGVGYILAKTGNNVQYRLSLGGCSKISSLGTTNSLKEGTRIYFSGYPLVSLPGNVLLNAHLVVSTPF